MSTLNIRIDPKTKRAASKVFKNLGIDLSSGVKLYLSQVVHEQGLPFKPNRTVNGFTPAQEVRMIRETERAERSGKNYSSLKELLDELK